MLTKNLILMACLVGGILLGYFTKRSLGKLPDRLFVITLVVLLFSMGASLGFMEDLLSRIASYGFNAITVTLFAMFFSAVITFIVFKISKKAND